MDHLASIGGIGALEHADLVHRRTDNHLLELLHVRPSLTNGPVHA